MSIRRRLNFDQFPRHFHVLFRCYFADWKIHVVSAYFFWCNFQGPETHVVFTYFFRRNFNGQKIHLVSTCFFWCIFAGRNIHVFSTYIFLCNFDVRKIHVVSTHFFWCNFPGQKSHVAFTDFIPWNFDGQKVHVVCTYFLPLLVTLKDWLLQDFSPYFSSKYPLCSPFRLKFEFYNFHYKKELPQVSFLGIYRTTTLPHNFWAATLLWSYSCKKVQQTTTTKK